MTKQRESVGLRKTSQGWEFSSEQTLEDFVWNHLGDLLQVNPFQRQISVMGEVCDILALTAERQLVIIELKNAEYRHVVQQLTRYYSNLLSEQPFSDSIDYEKPVRLIAIAPSFHRHNYIDRQYSQLSFEFIEAKVKKSEQFYLELTSDNTKSLLAKTVLPYTDPETDEQHEDLAKVPELLLEWIGSCSAADQQAFLRTRAQILRFDSRIQETVGAKSVQYGTGKTKRCAEICFDKRLQRPVLFLWLTLPTSWKSSKKAEQKGRLRIWLNDGKMTHVGHVMTGLGKMRLEEEWKAVPKSQWPRQALTYSLTYRSHSPVAVAGYARIALGIESSIDYLETCVSIALQKWLEKL
ncbi:MAG: recombinase RecB [Cyanobacteria bacterium P01_D01_bin.105]